MEKTMNNGAKKNSGFLNFIEVVGNKMPHPLTLFLQITAITIFLSFGLNKLGVSAVSPSSGEVVEVKNLLSLESLVYFMKNFIENFKNFPVLSNVMILSMASGFAEKVGFFRTIIEMFLKDTKGNKVVFVAAFIATLGNMFGDSAFLVIPLILATLFKGINRHPVAGLFLGYAAVGGGFGTAVIPGGWDLILTPITITAAKLIKPDFDMTYMSGYFFTFVATFVIAATTSFVTIKFIEPRLGKYTPGEEEIEENQEEVTPEKMAAAKKGLLGLLVFIVILVVLCYPQSSPFRSPTGSLVFGAPLMSSLMTLVVLFFFIPAYIYARLTKQVTCMKDLADLIGESVKGVVPFIVLSVVISQFLSFFAISNLGTVLAIKGGEILKTMAVPTPIICILFLSLVAFINIFIISGSSKYLIFGPIFVPMLMQLGIHPAFTQVIYRMGDAVTNHLSPLNAFFIILLTLVQKYDKNVGIGTIFSYMLPYTIAYYIVITSFILIWLFLGLDPGVGSTIFI